MLDEHYLRLLRCPINGQRLSHASEDLVRLVSLRLKEATEKQHPDRTISIKGIDGGLVREDGRMIYPVIDGIPRLLADEVIDLEQIGIVHDRSRS